MLNAEQCWKAVLARDRNGDLNPVDLTLTCLVAGRRKSSLDHLQLRSRAQTSYGLISDG